LILVITTALLPGLPSETGSLSRLTSRLTETSTLKAQDKRFDVRDDVITGLVLRVATTGLPLSHQHPLWYGEQSVEK
jgi:hypothetical protein